MKKVAIIIFIVFSLTIIQKIKAQHLNGYTEDRIYFNTNEFYRNPALLDVQKSKFRLTNEESLGNPMASNTSLSYFNKINNYSFAISTSFNYSECDYDDSSPLHSVHKFATIESFHKYKLSKIIALGLEMSYRRTSWTLFSRPYYENYGTLNANVFSINGGVSLTFKKYMFGLNYKKNFNYPHAPFIRDVGLSIQNIYRTNKMNFWCVFNVKNNYFDVDLVTNIGVSYSFDVFDVFTQYNFYEKRAYLNVKFNTKPFCFIVGGFFDFEKDSYSYNYRRHTKTVGINNSIIYTL